MQVPFVADVGRMWLNDVDVTPNAVASIIPLPLSNGWNHLEITTYNQNQGTQNEINYAFANRVDRIASTTNSPATNNLPVIQANYGWLFCGDVVQGTLSASGQVNVYSFNGNAGDVIRIALSGVDSAAAQIWLGTNSLGTFGGYHPFSPGLSQLTLPSSDTYSVYLSSDTHSLGSYSLGVAFATPRCGLPIACGQVLTNRLSDPSQIDIYSFTANAGEVVRLTCNGADAAAEVFNSAGVSLGAFGYHPFGPGLSHLTLPSTGTYTVLLSSGSRSLGNYSLGLAFATPRCGSPIVCGQVLTNQISDPSQVDIYTFTANAGETVRLTCNGADAIAEVFNAGGNSLGTFGYSRYGPGLSQLTLPATGTYTVFLTSGTQSMGNYSLGLSFDGGCVQQRLGQVVSNNLHLTILGEVGRLYRIDASTDLVNWLPLQTMTLSNAFFDFRDTNVWQHGKRFYRTVLLP